MYNLFFTVEEIIFIQKCFPILLDKKNYRKEAIKKWRLKKNKKSKIVKYTNKSISCKNRIRVKGKFVKQHNFITVIEYNSKIPQY